MVITERGVQTKRLVIALGGNAMLRPGQRGTAVEQRENVANTCKQMAELVKTGYELIITHGNGPQVGSILIQNEAARAHVPAMPLDVCGAMTQGQLGYMIQGELMHHLRALGMQQLVATVITRVVVDEQDEAFEDPTKPIGPFFQKEEACQLMQEEGYIMKEDANRGWRRVVASPQPVDIVEKDAINTLVAAGVIVIANGGGGIPVKRSATDYEGVEAVIDKDLAGELLAREVGAKGFIILTDVEQVLLDFGKPNERSVSTMTVKEAEEYIAQGHFMEGSMLPKVQAAVKFTRSTGGAAIITSLERVEAALAGEAGTRVIGG